MARKLAVFLYRQYVGDLIQDDHGEMTFVYCESWLTKDDAIPLSHSLPLRKLRYTRKECRPFFGGVLPEGDNRELIARNVGVSSKNDFAMLDKIGGDCAGAVTFLRPDECVPEPTGNYKALTDSELADTLRALPKRPLLAGDENIRMSLAGAQNKIAVHVVDDHISLPLDGSPSTHILKPAIARFEGVVFDEMLCMKLASAVGLPTAVVSSGNVDGIDYLLVERYDRARIDAITLRRIHQEDLCQALGIPSERKYQNDGGPTLKQSMGLVREASSVPIIDLVSLLDGGIYNFLIGNNDAHGKNFSLLYYGETRGELETRLAPFYDLLSTAYYPELSKKMAMKIVGEYDSEQVFPRHFERLAEEAGLGKPMVLRRVQELAKLIISTLPRVTREDSVSHRVAELIRSRCERTLQRFRE